MNTNIKKHFAPANGKFSLAKFETSYNGDLDKAGGQAALETLKQELKEYQEKLYVNGRHAVLIIFQAMDAAGKDSAIDHVMSGLNPQGCEVHSFKTPSAEEYQHDFLWRHASNVPKRGMIGIHNRSHYENVLVSKVHPEYLVNERLPDLKEGEKIADEFWNSRYESINNFEKHLVQNGTVIIKFFLHLSKAEQKERLLKRINDPEKNWKFASGDLNERELWPKYMDAYEKAIKATSTKHAPWYIIPADKKWYARLAIAEILKHNFENLKLKLPELSEEEMDMLQKDKEKLMAE